MSSSSATPLGRPGELLSLRPYLARHQASLLTGVAMVLATNLAAAAGPWILGRAVDQLQHGVQGELLLGYAILLLAASTVEGGFRYLMRRILIGASRRIEYDLRNDFFAHLQTLTPAFYDRHSTGDVMARATNDLAAVRMVLGPGIMYSLNTLFSSTLVIAILLHLHVRLALFTLLPLLAVSYSARYFGRKIHQRFERIQEQFSTLTTLAEESISGIRVIKAYHEEEAFKERFRAANAEYVSRSLALVRIWGVFSPWLTLLLGLSSVFLLWYGGRQVLDGMLTLGDFVAFLAYLGMLTWPTIALGWVINIFERGAASMGRINHILNTRPPGEVEREPAPEGFWRPRGEIEIRGLDFSYGRTRVLQNICLRIPAGHTVAVVGATGSGKSTLVHLLCRLYPVDDRRILIDGIDINRIPSARLRRAIGLVPQDTFLFSESVAGNIAFGNPGAPLGEIEEAARNSTIWSDIQHFPRRFDTPVGERGITLSGGQKQRVAISRALLLDPPILILDDALSSVDTETEEKVLRALRRCRKGRTCLLVSHRVSTVRDADRIVVMEGGAIVEEGTHDELLARQGLYASLYRKQRLEQELEAK